MRYEIIDEDGAVFISADTIATVAAMMGTTAKRQAEHDCKVHNQEAGAELFTVRSAGAAKP